ncbi:D-alanine--D-alanine ligase [Candidatus Poribacteria bacterium]|nr:D-alanine--D-alanine ligase [Candidatus Poribacteria bacterium]
MRLFNKLGVLLGGSSGERSVSLLSGQRVSTSLRRQDYEVIDIDLVKDDWLTQLISEEVDAVFLALHGKGYEDGTIQAILSHFGLPYTGSGILASALGMNKIMSKQIFSTMQIPTPDYLKIHLEEDLKVQTQNAIEQLGLPLVVKPASEGSSLGVSIIHEPDEIYHAIEKNRIFKDNLFEKYVQGQEITVGLIGVGDDLQALPILELIPKREFYDYQAKYTAGLTEFVIPARLSDEVSQVAQSIALRAHQALECHGYSRVDMIVDRLGQPFVTEVNTLPGLTELSDLPAQAAAAGISYDRLISKILDSAILRDI